MSRHHLAPATRSRLAPQRSPVPRRQASAVTAAPILLADATWYGTLAAVRDLGSRGVPVYVGYDHTTAVARFSRHVGEAVRCPSVREPERFFEWLLAFGARHPGCVLYPTSDDVAFLIAVHRAELAEHFRLFTPTPEVLLELLDKSRLSAAAERAGLAAAPTFSPVDESEVRELGLLGPLLVKPRAQILSGGAKGVRVEAGEDLVAAWSAMRSAASVHAQALALAPDLDFPIVQPYVQMSESIYTVDGFVDGSGTLVAALACEKRLQLPRRSGGGVLFEPAALDPAVSAGLRRLCRETGFVGVFDAEFAVDGDRKLLIDFNPRLYNHMGFEVDRGLPLPWLAYLSATGQGDLVSGELFAARRRAAGSSGVYAHRLPLRILLAAQRLTGRMSRDEARQWRALVRDAGVLTDPAGVRGDRFPAAADAVQQLRHPRSLWRKAAR
jgi:D-aspartate ligase